MGPTTAALLRFFQADQALHTAQERLNSATSNVRGQGTKVDQLRADYAAAHHKTMEFESKAKELELELKSREDRIELLRERQQNATDQKQYQALIVEINTHKLDKGKFEEQALGLMEQAAASKKVEAELKTRLDAEGGKHKTMSGDIDARVSELTGAVNVLKGPRDQLAAEIPHAALAVYRRAAERYEGEAMAQIEKPDPRDTEYLCTGCNTYLVTNIYNRLMSSKDEIVLCPSCSRILFVPEDLTPEKALSMKLARGDAKPKAKKAPALNADGTPKVRAPRKKKEKSVIAAGKNAEPGSLAAALAAGALAASGKGHGAKENAPTAPLPSRADGTANVSDTADAPVGLSQSSVDEDTAEDTAGDAADVETTNAASAGTEVDATASNE